MEVKSGNPILNAVLSKLLSERDEALAQLDLIINKNMSDSGVSGIVEQALSVSKKISETENTLDFIRKVIQDNNAAASASLIEQLTQAQNNKKVKKNGINS